MLITGRIMMDASVRRFKAQKIYLRSCAAARWIHFRDRIVQGRAKNESHVSLLAQAQACLHAVGSGFAPWSATDNCQEIASITDARVYNDLRIEDSQRGYWLAEDAPLAAIQSWIYSGLGNY